MSVAARSPLVSILVPVHNRADLLKPCLESALAQTVTDFEVVVVDGASTDDAWSVCQSFAAKDSRVRIFRDAEDLGPGPGWSRCLAEARGTYATFLWSDDMIQPAFLERLLDLLQPPGTAFAFSAAEIGPEPGTGRVEYSHPTGRIPSRDFVEGSLPGNGRFPVSPACALFRLSDLRTSLMLELPTDPAFDLRSTGAGTDLLFFLLTALRYPEVGVASEPLAFFRAHPSSITVDGRAGRVQLDYARTRCWFCRMFGFSERESAVVARFWLQEIRRRRAPIDPDQSARRVGSGLGRASIVRSAMADALRAFRSSAERLVASPRWRA